MHPRSPYVIDFKGSCPTRTLDSCLKEGKEAVIHSDPRTIATPIAFTRCSPVSFERNIIAYRADVCRPFEWQRIANYSPRRSHRSRTIAVRRSFINATILTKALWLRFSQIIIDTNFPSTTVVPSGRSRNANVMGNLIFVHFFPPLRIYMKRYRFNTETDRDENFVYHSPY